MVIERAVVLQVLEALEAMNPYPASKEDQRAGALTALRTVLARERVGPAQEPAEVMTERDHFEFARWHSRLGELADAYYAAGGTNPARWRARAELMQHALDAATGWRVRSAASVQQQAAQAEPVQKSLPCPTPKTCREHCCGGWCIPQAAPVQAKGGGNLPPPLQTPALLQALQTLVSVCQRMDLEHQAERPSEAEYQAAIKAAQEAIEQTVADKPRP